VEFANRAALRPEGANRVADTGAAGVRAATTTTALQGSLEKSNADVIRSMVDLIANERWFDANEKSIQTQDDAVGQAITTVGRTNA
jgi:flagellar basal-body rod protein FlgG